MQNALAVRAFSLQDVTDFGTNLANWTVAHLDQAPAVLASIEAVGAAMAAGDFPTAWTAFTPIVTIIKGDLAAFQVTVTDAHRHACKAACEGGKLGANGAIIAALIAALQKAGGLSAFIQGLIPAIQALITLFPKPVVTPVA